MIISGAAYCFSLQDAIAFLMACLGDRDPQLWATITVGIDHSSTEHTVNTSTKTVLVASVHTSVGAAVCRPEQEDTRPRVLMLMGLAASLDAWKPQILDMLTPLVRT